MNRTFTLLIGVLLAYCANAQTNKSDVKSEQPYGVIDTADLTMKQCDFEKDANAEVLFDKGDYIFEGETITYIHHKRIKILTQAGEKQAKAVLYRVELDRIKDFKGQTINLVGKTIKYIAIDQSEIHKQKINSAKQSVNFAFPDVHAGSVIEYQYKMNLESTIPSWIFRDEIPTRSSEITATYRDSIAYKFIQHVNRPYFKDTLLMLNGVDAKAGVRYVKQMINIPSFKLEPYISPANEIHDRVVFLAHEHTWAHEYNRIVTSRFFGLDLNDKLTNEKDLVAIFDMISDPDRRADSIFTYVRDRMSWNGHNEWHTDEGSQRAWDKKRGNSSEINIILFHLLKQCGIKSLPVLVSTPENGVVDTDYVYTSQFNKTVVYVETDDAHNYIMDATDKHAVYNQDAYKLIGSYGFFINPYTAEFRFIRISGNNVTKKLVAVNATIQPDGKMTGTTEILTDTYGKADDLESYKKMGEKGYINYLCNYDNNMHVSAFAIDTASVDSIPLTQHLNFTLNLASEDKYIYFNAKLFTGLWENPFLNEHRESDIDFVFNGTNVISGIYKIPIGYTVDAIPQNISIYTSDKSISFKRLISLNNGTVQLRYIITRNRRHYKVNQYSEIYKFYKEMFRMLDEQIVFKKS